jgi:hypothetical protein
VIQACGRVVRAPDDYGATYLADSSLLDLFDRTRGEMPAWFRDQVDRLSVPDLPDFETAADAASASRSGGHANGSSGSTRGTGRDSGRAGRDTGGSAGPSGSATDGGGRGSDSGSDHPLSDVWGDG